MTECSGGGWSGPWHSNFVSNMRRLFVGGANNWGSSTLLWNMALDEHAGPRCQGGACCTDCRGVLTVPSNASGMADITKNVEFYSLAHFSSFVLQGSIRVKSQRGGRGAEATVAAAGSQCSVYCGASRAACGWTKEYSCPWAKAPGTKGRAGDDGSAGYKCCCVDRTAAGQPCMWWQRHGTDTRGWRIRAVRRLRDATTCDGDCLASAQPNKRATKGGRDGSWRAGL